MSAGLVGLANILTLTSFSVSAGIGNFINSKTSVGWIATSINFTAGNQFVFTSNGNYDISYKVNAEGKVVCAGPPMWAGSNLVAAATGSFTVILDLSAGNGSYTYKIQ